MLRLGAKKRLKTTVGDLTPQGLLSEFYKRDKEKLKCWKEGLSKLF